MKPSRALIYFLLGLILPFMAFRLAYADECGGGDAGNSAISYFETIWDGYNLTFLGFITQTQYDDGDTPDTVGDFFSPYTSAGTYTDTDTGLDYVAHGHREGLYINYYIVLPSGVSCEVQDTDNDGLPDDCDAYPDDSTSYSIKLVSYQTSDNQWDSDHVRECYETDRGDYYCIGSAYDNSLVTRYRENSAWIDPSDVCSSGETMTDAEDGEDTYENPAVSNEDSDGDADADTDPTLQGGEQSDGTETGDAALRDIIDNTGDIASNTKRIGEYAYALNAAIQNMENNLILMNERAESESAASEEQEAVAETGQETFEDYDVESALGDQIDPTITEGEDGDYQAHGPLAEETWITEFIDSNPISTVLSESGFEYSDASATTSLDLGYLGQHYIDISPLEDGLIAFGNLLVALTTLTGLIHVVTGRRF